MIGPLLAFAILAAAPLAFNSIFVVSFCLALVGLAILVLFVQPKQVAPDAVAPARAPSLRGAFGLLAIPRYRALVLAGGALALATVSDAFVFLALQKKLDIGTSLFPLLFVGSASTYMLLAVPMGKLADRVGRGRVLLGGYAMLFVVYMLILAPAGGWIVLLGALGLLGAYYAATDGVLMAFGSQIVPDEVRGSGLALVGTVTNIGKLIASIVFGALWTVWGINAAVACFAAALVVTMSLAALLLVRSREAAHS